MCGMVGSYGLADLDVQAAMARIAHRGPDGQGFAKEGPARHGHVRLALVDLTAASAQPFRHRGGLLSFVGEIWNHKEVRKRLEKAGERFATSGDTEVLAAALSRWGIEGLARLEGMFTFAWSSGQETWLARDRFGKVPLYVHRNADGWAWCSELKGLGRHHPGAALPPGHAIDLRTGKMVRWYDLPDVAPATPASVRRDLRQGTVLRMAADAPVCCLVSGGLDSSLVLSLAMEAAPDVTAFTAVMDPRSSDLEAARKLCAHLGVKLVEVLVPEPTGASLSEAVSAIEISSKAQVEIAALCIPLARAIAAEGFKACLSGEGADELFGGYGNMCIQASRADDQGWRQIRLDQLSKMARGNFVRCNKAFMAAGVECRLPFLHRPLVESVIAAGKAACPPGKKLLKEAAKGIVPGWVVSRQKDTFQGASGMATAAARAVANPTRFYNAERQTLFGASQG